MDVQKGAFSSMNFLRRDEALFLLLWCSGYIGAKLGVPLAGTFTLLFWRYALVLAVVALIVTWRGEWRRPDAGTFLEKTGFWAHFVWLVAILKAFEYGIGADSGVTGAAAWVYALPMLATASLTFITLWERRRSAGAGI